MSYPPTPWHAAPCDPCGHHHGHHPGGHYHGHADYGHHDGYGAFGWPACPPAAAASPVMFMICAPAASYGAGAESQHQWIPYELTVVTASTPQEVLIGGKANVHLSLEYLADTGAASPSVKVTVTFDGSTSSWSESPIPTGYQVKGDFMTVQPGSKVVVDVTEATAKLRWCESICC